MVFAEVALASRAGLAEGFSSGFLVAGLGLLTRLGSGEAEPAPPNFFTESATLVTVRLGRREGGGRMEGGKREGEWREGRGQ